jgi:large-conductance mechanosensitive channel
VSLLREFREFAVKGNVVDLGPYRRHEEKQPPAAPPPRQEKLLEEIRDLLKAKR